MGLEGVRVPVDEVAGRGLSAGPRLVAFGEGSSPGTTAMSVALVFLALTGLLLIWDLRQPRRFLWTLTKPQWRSWLVRGSYVIAAYGLLLGAQLLAALAGRPVPRALAGLTMLLAAATALYTAFLFGQSKGRDLWQSALLGPHLIVQALTAGAALFAPAWLLWLLPVNGLLVAGEVWGHHATEDARRAARLIQEDVRFSSGVLAVGASPAPRAALVGAGRTLRWRPDARRPLHLGAPLRAEAPAHPARMTSTMLGSLGPVLLPAALVLAASVLLAGDAARPDLEEAADGPAKP